MIGLTILTVTVIYVVIIVRRSNLSLYLFRKYASTKYDFGAQNSMTPGKRVSCVLIVNAKHYINLLQIEESVSKQHLYICSGISVF
jgi:hypothetical protein